jgi:hypothetical protein
MHNAPKLPARNRSLAARVAAARPLPPPARPLVMTPAEEEIFEYRPVCSEGTSPDVDTDIESLEVKVFWGRSLLRVTHLEATRSFAVGEDAADCYVPAAKLGQSRAVLFAAGHAIIPAGTAALISVGDEADMGVEEALARGLASACAEGHRVAMGRGVAVRFELADMAVEMRGVKRARKVAALALGAAAGGALLSVLGSLVGHVGLLAAVAASAPNLGATADDVLTDEQRYLMQQYLDASAQREMEPAQEEALADAAPNGGETGGTGTAAKGDPGTMGAPTALPANKRWAIQGESPRPVVSRNELMKEAMSFGAIGILATLDGSENEPHALWGEARSEGADPMSADGSMWGDQIGAAWGADGLALTGVGEGGGGLGAGIGLGDVGTAGHGSGYDCLTCGGFGESGGYLRRTRKSEAPTMRQADDLKLSGRLPPEVIQRIVRMSAGRAQACYESALRGNPNLQGRVSVRFMIARNGTVSHATASGDLPDAGVKACVANAFTALTFPKPDGTVTVSYGYMFTPAG